MNPPHEHLCPGCGAVLVAGHATYCSRRCRERYRYATDREHKRAAARGQKRTVTAQPKSNPARTRARMHVADALRRGKMRKPAGCEQCGASAHRLEAHHHHGYEHPLDVLWLCSLCHGLTRRKYP